MNRSERRYPRSEEETHKEHESFFYWKKRFESADTVEAYIDMLRELKDHELIEDELHFLIEDDGLLDQIRGKEESDLPLRGDERKDIPYAGINEGTEDQFGFDEIVYAELLTMLKKYVFKSLEAGVESVAAIINILAEDIRNALMKKITAGGGVPYNGEYDRSHQYAEHNAPYNADLKWRLDEESYSSSNRANFTNAQKVMSLQSLIDPDRFKADLDAWIDHPYPYKFTRAICDIFELVDEEQAQYLLAKRKKARIEKKVGLADTYDWILKNVDVGPVSIQGNTFDILDKHFIIEGHIPKDAIYVQQLDSAETISIFGRLGPIGYIQVKSRQMDRSGYGETITATINENLGYNLLFSHEGGYPEEKRNRFLIDLPDFHIHYRNLIGNLSVREIFWVYQFIGEEFESKEAQHKAQVLIELKEKYGIEGIRCLLATEADEKSSGRIISMAKYFEAREKKEIAQDVFHQFSEIIRAAEELDIHIEDFFTEHNYAEGLSTTRISTSILNKATGLLKKYHTVMRDDEKMAQLITLLEGVNREVVAFSAIFREKFKGAERVDISVVNNLSLNRERAIKISPIDQERMKEIVFKNWSTQESAIVEEVVRGLEGAFSQKETEFFILRIEDLSEAKGLQVDTENEYANNILGFFGFTPIPEKPDELYGQWFNVNSNYRGAGIGEVMMLGSLTKVVEESPFHITASPAISVGIRYVEDIGFRITGIEEIKKDIWFYTMVADVKQNADAISRYMTEEDLLAFIDQDDNPKGLIVRAFSAEDHWQVALDTVERLTKEGYDVHRYFDHPDGKQRVFVFEQVEEKSN
ncbi:hypothetical protein KKG22_05545 [Patescibacteria group bacterium]|nr:hypothetical protein [Patescibacteria group bacterium]MBU1721541.1 hypothetical protein [Patescibacteria group bacterium]MBU1901747.1 hypothetical protein [Patescibacteria group bacterium]